MRLLNPFGRAFQEIYQQIAERNQIISASQLKPLESIFACKDDITREKPFLLSLYVDTIYNVVLTNTEVYQMDERAFNTSHISRTKQNVLRLDVLVNYAVLVQVTQALELHIILDNTALTN